jgi:DNA-binding transcriptional LysR family regulator
MFSRRAIYFDEVAKRQSVRGASERLRIAPSAVDRQILQLEQQLGVDLFERTSRGLRLTSAGELLIDAVRRWRREFERVKAQIDALQGLRRGELSIGLVEGASQFFGQSLKSFQSLYPGINHRLRVAGSDGVVDMILRGECDVGLTFNPPDSHAVRIERTLIYRLGAVMPPSHALAANAEVSLQQCADFPLIVPDESISLRDVIDHIWGVTVGAPPRFAMTASNISLIKTMILNGAGVGLLTAVDAFDEIERGDLVFRPLSDDRVKLSALSLISASGRTLPVAATLLLQHLAGSMQSQGNDLAVKPGLLVAGAPACDSDLAPTAPLDAKAA